MGKINRTHEIMDSFLDFINTVISKNERIKVKLNESNIHIYLPKRKLSFYLILLYKNTLQFKTKIDQLIRMKKAEAKGVHLIQIFEDEWVNKRAIVESKIKHQLNLHKISIYARKCRIKEIESKTKNDFLIENHIQGKDTASIKYGLFDGNELVSVMSLTKPRLNLGIKRDKIKEGMYELSRFASLKAYNVVGAFSRLLTHIIKNHDILYIKTYADLRYTRKDNNVYLTNGFILHHISDPSYFYTFGTERINRFNFRKQELKRIFPNVFDINKTEREICNESGYYAIYDCGALCLEMFIDPKTKEIAKEEKEIIRLRDKLFNTI